MKNADILWSSSPKEAILANDLTKEIEQFIYVWRGVLYDA